MQGFGWRNLVAAGLVGLSLALAVRATDDRAAAQAWEPDLVQVPAQGPGPAADLILFASDRTGEFQLHVMALDGTNPRRVAATPGKTFETALSCNGRIAAVVERPGTNEHSLYTVNLDGSNLSHITAGPGDHMPTWRPDGFQIAFSSDPPDVDIHLINADGSGRIRVTSDPTAEYWPHWSPDAGLFAIQYGGRGTPSDVYTVSADGSTYRRLTFTGDAGEPRWGPGGARIVFSRKAGGDSDVYAVEPATGQVAPVITGATYDQQPAWLPDGSRILFVRGRESDRDAEIWSARPDGSDARNLSQSPGSRELWPATACLSPSPPVATATPPARPTPVTDGGCTCDTVARQGVPNAVILDAFAHPEKYYGWGLRLDPGKPPGPANPLRQCLSLQNRAIHYHPLFNRPIWRAGCP